MISVPGFTATTGAGWQTPGWRTTRTTGTDPWAAGAGTPLDTTPAAGGGLLLGGAGELVLPGGLEALGARVYDPTTRAFLSPDPQNPTTGAGWAGNPYAYAANNPVAFTDPSGLHPLTDTELDQWKDQHKTGLAAAGDWLSDNWEYIAAGAMVAAGVALMFTGVGGPAGVALMSLSGALTSGGISIAQQKHDNGAVDWARVGTDAAIGAIPIPGGGAAKGATTAGREAAETAGREALKATGRETAEQAARTTGEQALEDAGKQPLALGLNDYLESFAAEHGAYTWRDFPKGSNWRDEVLKRLNDPEQPVLFNLTGVDNPYAAAARSAAGSPKAGATDWELLQVYQNDFPNLEFWENGISVPNPFEG